MTASSSAFTTYLAQMRPLVEAALTERLPQGEAGATCAEEMDHYLYDPLARYTKNAGKRIRPVLALLGCEAAGGAAESALSVACAIEDFQSAALIHDDIADEGELRRGEPCLHITMGVGMAINVGDLALISVVNKIVQDDGLSSTQRLQVLDELLHMEQRTLEGQALDLGWARDERWNITVDDYLVMASHKTAYYSAATPLALGAICAGAPSELVEALRGFGMHAGLAFQLQDDLLNLAGDANQGKDFRTDITEGKRTYAVAHALEHLDAEKRAELVSILSSHTTEAAELARAVELMEAAGSLEAVRSYAQALIAQAKLKLEGVELAGQSRQILESMADFFVERTK